MVETSLATLFWDPDPILIRLPVINWPIAWYGILFALGFFLSFMVMKQLVIARFREEKLETYRIKANFYVDRFLWAVVIGTLIGARLGHILLYDLSHYLAHPGEILKVWHGGLASHGGAVGILCALVIFYWWMGRRYPIGPFRLLDLLVVPTPIACAFIRFGNFVNQEILGTPSERPWAVTFGHPFDGSFPIPRHPVQLYESIVYLVIGLFLLTLYRIPAVRNRSGLASGLFFVLMFSSRFILEMFKEPYVWGSLNMGQWLSLPFVAGGLLLSGMALKKKTVKGLSQSR